jgi:hypothetical protein
LYVVRFVALISFSFFLSFLLFSWLDHPYFVVLYRIFSDLLFWGLRDLVGLHGCLDVRVRNSSDYYLIAFFCVRYVYEISRHLCVADHVALIAWLFQLTCSHRAWLLLKYKQELRKNLQVRYSTVDGMGDTADNALDPSMASSVGSINGTSRPFSHRMSDSKRDRHTSEYTMSSIATDSSDPHGTDDEYQHGSDENSLSTSTSAFSFDEVMKYF